MRIRTSVTLDLSKYSKDLQDKFNEFLKLPLKQKIQDYIRAIGIVEEDNSVNMFSFRFSEMFVVIAKIKALNLRKKIEKNIEKFMMKEIKFFIKTCQNEEENKIITIIPKENIVDECNPGKRKYDYESYFNKRFRGDLEDKTEVTNGDTEVKPKCEIIDLLNLTQESVIDLESSYEVLSQDLIGDNKEKLERGSPDKLKLPLKQNCFMKHKINSTPTKDISLSIWNK
ncbi:hypothetical protein ACFFRR_003759 [Megaselia abdita]